MTLKLIVELTILGAGLVWAAATLVAKLRSPMAPIESDNPRSSLIEGRQERYLREIRTQLEEHRAILEELAKAERSRGRHLQDYAAQIERLAQGLESLERALEILASRIAARK